MVIVPFVGRETPNQDELKIINEKPVGVVLKESDVKRINKELETLKQRL